MRSRPFSRLLIANRGEIALRITRTARRLGLRTIAVYSEIDRGARHTREADGAVPLGGPDPARSYLDGEAVLAAARASGADAVHPGYGFLSENAAFAAACEEAGLVFVGPSPEAIRTMGDKGEAKRLMAAAGLPCLPGYEGEEQDDGRLAAEAGRIGYPVMIKAAAGGGGRGMRLAAGPDDLGDLLRAARAEARASFGDDRLILERALPDPRHVEVQVFGDVHGGVVHLGERDCSVQRRHQKLIEEAPSPAVGPELRGRMGEASCRAARAIGYVGAGTMEYLLDDQGSFFFMEMNTRLQVEHPVTEAVTGLDLVEWQLRIAAGEALPLRQDEIVVSGHAVEARLCAEDPARGFLPGAGRIARWRPAADLRVESALEDGAIVPAAYDSMIAKFVAQGRDRDEARRRLIDGLERTIALGVPTNGDWLCRALGHPAFAAGEATTAFVAEHGPALLAARAGERDGDVALAALVLLIGRRPGGTRSPLCPAWPVPMRLSLGDGETVEVAAVWDRDGAVRIRTAAGEHRFADLSVEGETVRFVRDGVRSTAVVATVEGALLIQQGSRAFAATDLSFAPARGAPDAAAGDGVVRASMAGRIAAVLVALGEPVSAGQPILTLEAMKMEHVHRAPRAGRVAALSGHVGEQAVAGRVLAVIEEPDTTLG